MNRPVTARGRLEQQGAPSTRAAAIALLLALAGVPPLRAEAMPGAFGSYPYTREASGTSWQPDASVHAGRHVMSGKWMFMGHALLDSVYDWQGGARGDEKSFLSGMLLGMARRSAAGGDVLQLRAMLSPDPLMGKSGYPLLLATGESADGHTPLIDRQHPHDLFMELSASYSHPLTGSDSVYVYAGLPGEPAFGPPAFMHRLSIMDSPEAPISHHWLDSTHIAFGVATLGYVHDRWKVEASRFRGREPDQYRYNIETGPLDSTATRVSWNPDSEWSLQLSWASLRSPEQLEPGVDQRKWSGSAIYTRACCRQGWWSTTLAWGRRTSDRGWLDAVAFESALKLGPAWTVFWRGERVENDELLWLGGQPGPAFTVAKAAIGAVRDFRGQERVVLGLGALYARNFLPGTLGSLYGTAAPEGLMAFVRLKIQ
ncbi:MAG TPA: hypothetical protein VF931_00695 [Steroidobacteraceae bacterium]